MTAIAALLAVAATAGTIAACSESGNGQPQAGVAPGGASDVDAGVTNGAISYSTLNLQGLMGDALTQVERMNAAARVTRKMSGQAVPPPPELDPQGTPDYFGSTPNWANSPRLRKFVDELPGVGPGGANNLGQSIPAAVPDTITYPGSDYYEIAVREYSEQLHSDLPPTRLRGYVQVNRGTGAAGLNTVEPAPVHYLGPLVRARRGRPVRIKFVNQLPAGRAGDLFLPVDSTITGAGSGPSGGDTVYPQNRASLRLHGGLAPWISGAAQYQWVTPADERSPYRSGPCLVNVPDMWFDAQGRPVKKRAPGATNDPGPGATTLYFPNAQSARFLYLHDDTFGLTRLSVYAGEVAPYFIGDPVEDELIGGNAGKANGERAIDATVAAGTVPAAELPLLIEDKTFVPAVDQLRLQDPTWDIGRWGGQGALWYPHVYMPNQNASDDGNVNPKGRWDYLPWYWEGYTDTVNGPVDNPLYGTALYQPEKNPGTPNPSAVPDAFHDTMLVNGTAYPYVGVERKAYRLRILNACADRQLNLQIYYAMSNEIAETGPGGRPELQTYSGEVAMLPTASSLRAGWPARWPTDWRPSGVPDPDAIGPTMIQIGNDGGLLPQAVPLPTTPVGYEYKAPSRAEGGMGAPFVVAITGRTLYLAPGERADVIVDFSQVPRGSKLILYNDAPSPAPIGDSRVDYYTDNQALIATGGAPPTVAGYGPNTRTIMQFQVEGPAAAGFDLERLQAALPGAYAAAQDPVLVPTAAYDEVYGSAESEGVAEGTSASEAAPAMGEAAPAMGEAAPATPEARQTDSGTLTFIPLGRSYRLTLPVQGKMVSELFDPVYGRRTVTLGVDAPLSAAGARTQVPYSAIDPATEYVGVEQEADTPRLGDSTQLWRITHDGTESHSISFGAFAVQVVERARRDGKARAPDPGELGWKDTLRIDPLESCLVALRPVAPNVPFKLGASQRSFDVTRPLGAEGGFTELDQLTAAPTRVVNELAYLNWEAYWSVHLPGGEESHAVRPLALQGSPQMPEGLTAVAEDGVGVTLTWTASRFPPPVRTYILQRSARDDFSGAGKMFSVDRDAESWRDDTARSGRTYFYRIRAEGDAGWSAWSAIVEVSLP